MTTDQLPTAERADSTKEPGEPKARDPNDPERVVEDAESEAIALLDEYGKVFGSRLPQAGEGAPVERLAHLRRKIHEMRPDDDDVPTALCLSGGGIRSATFGLGVLQGLARSGWLERFDYLSTVSGGGYVGCWLAAWLHRGGPSDVVAELKASAVGRLSEPGVVPDPVSQPQPEPDAVRRLRAYSNYLSPAVGLGGDLMALVAIFVRNLFLHWLVLVPALLAVLMVPRVYLTLIDAPCVVAYRWPLFALAVFAVGLSIAYMAADLPETPKEKKPPPKTKPKFKLRISPNIKLRIEPKSRFWWLNYAPLVVASLLFGLLAPSLISWARNGTSSLAGAALVYAVGFGLLHLVAGLIGTACRGLHGSGPRKIPDPLIEALVTVAVGAIGGAVLLIAMALLSNWWTGSDASATGPLAADRLAWRERYAIVAAPAMMAVFWLTVTLYAGWTRRRKSEEDREWWARAAGYWLLSAIGWCALTAAVVLLPRLLLAAPHALGLDAGPGLTGGAALLGVLTSAWGYWSRNGQKIAGQVQGVLARLNARLLDVLSAAFIVLLAAVLGLALSHALERIGRIGDDSRAVPTAERAAAEPAARCAGAATADCPNPVSSDAVGTFRRVLHSTGFVAAFGVFIGLALIAWGMAYLIGTNTFSLHSMYGNRLIRAYLGASNPRRHPHPFTGFDRNDNVDLAALASCRPFPVINAALNLVQASGDRLEWQQRKAASFTFTPLACGSPVLGYASTKLYARKPAAGASGLSVGRAMAVSGAAASPNMGYHSSPVVAFVMSFFNVRLGWWLPNLRVLRGRGAREKWARDEPPGLKTLIAETLARTTERTDFVYLSDGGHFENLGLYEMVRRRCRRIVVVDATCDPHFHHEDLLSSIRKIRIDFGISVVFPHGLPTAASCGRDGKPWALGRVHYADADPDAPAGSVVYLKPALWDGLSPDVRRYAEASDRRGSKFPHQSTADQFFNEDQFESYRLLGLLTVLKAFGEPGRWPEGDGPDHREPRTPSAGTPSSPPSALGRAARRVALWSGRRPQGIPEAP